MEVNSIIMMILNISVMSVLQWLKSKISCLKVLPKSVQQFYRSEKLLFFMFSLISIVSFCISFTRREAFSFRSCKKFEFCSAVCSKTVNKININRFCRLYLKCLFLFVYLRIFNSELVYCLWKRYWFYVLFTRFI